MRTITLGMDSNLSAIYNDEIIRQGENLASELNITLSDDFIGYKYVLVFQLNSQTPVVTNELFPVENVITYVIPNVLTIESGNLKLELQAFDDAGTLIKTAVIYLKVKSSIEGTFDVVPEEYVPWYIPAVEGAVTATEQADIATLKAEEAFVSATNAGVSEDNAKVSEDNAKASELSAQATASQIVVDEATRQENEINRAFFDEYSPTIPYVVGNKVAYLGSSYYCIVNAPAGTLPTNETYFIMMASKGDAGGNVILDDTTPAIDKVYSSTKVSSELAAKANQATTYTKTETDSLLALKANVLPMHYYDTTLGEYVNVDKFWEALKNGKIYTTEFNNYSVSPSSLGTKKDDNAGLVATPSTNAAANRDDYVKIGLFMPIDVNGYVDTNDNYHVTAIKGDGRFKADGTNGDVYVMNMTGFLKRFDTATTWGYSYSDAPYAGYIPVPGSRKVDGTIRPYVLRAKYPAGINPIDGKLASISGVNIEYTAMSHNDQITKFASKGVQYSGKTSHDDFWVKLMLFLKYASTNTETLAKGCISYYYQYTPSVLETGVTRFVVTNAQAANLVVGSRVSIGNYAGFAKTEDRQSTLVSNVKNRVKILSIEALPDGFNTAVNLDTTAFDTVATSTISTMVWGCGACDNVFGVDGSPISNTSGKEPLLINGIEIIHGGYEVIQNLIIYNDNTNVEDYNIKLYMCYDCKKYATAPTADYTLLSKRLVKTNNTWMYMSKAEIDSQNPSLMIPAEAAAGSTTGFADGIYTNTPTTGYRVWRSLGNLQVGTIAGLFYLFAGNGLTDSAWGILGRLSATGRSVA